MLLEALQPKSFYPQKGSTMHTKLLAVALVSITAVAGLTACSSGNDRYLLVYLDTNDTASEKATSIDDIKRSLEYGGQITLHSDRVNQVDKNYPEKYVAKIDFKDDKTWSYYPKPAMLGFVSSHGWKLHTIGDGALLPFVFTKPSK